MSDKKDLIYNQDGRQYHIGLSLGNVGKYVILPGDPKRCEKIASYLENPELMANSREYVTYTGYLEGEKVSVTSTGIGGPSASIAIQELANLGAEKFIRVGTSGGMQLNVLGGDLVIATGAVRAEGTSREYAPIEYPAIADYKIVNHLVDAAKKLDKTYHVGVVHCKDSFYGQHSPEDMPVSYELENKWNAWIKMGCLASEMESAALFTVAQYLGVDISSIFLVVANQEREKRGLTNPIVHNTEDAIEVAIEAIKSMIKKDKEQQANGFIIL